MADTIFGKIIAGEIPCHRVFENEHVLAFLDVNPLAEGHTLVVPKKPYDRLEKIPANEAADMFRCLGAIAKRVLTVTGAHGYNILQNNGRVAGQEVNHVHFHIIPRHAGDGLGYRWKPQPGDAAALAALAKRLRDA
ncbi:MAG: HIT family protein [Phycisphaerae bacterium]|nr:HIT family protein [Phycisphaerae bacterium]